MLQSAGKKKRVGKVSFATEPDIIPNSNAIRNQQQNVASSLEAASLEDTRDNTGPLNLTHNLFSPNLGDKGSIRFKSREDRTRTAREAGISTGGTVSNPDFKDTLKRVSVVLQQHIIRGERLKRKYHAKRDRERAARQAAGATFDSYGSRSPEMSISFSSEGQIDLNGDRPKFSLPKSAVQLSVGGGETKTTTLGNPNNSKKNGPSEPRISMSASLPVSERLAASSR
tara:strand:- start:40 stop:720 length:681 start_codon:yes stop_codon:yes gene_type:complete